MYSRFWTGIRGGVANRGVEEEAVGNTKEVEDPIPSCVSDVVKGACCGVG